MTQKILLAAGALLILLALTALVATIWLSTAATWEFDPDIQSRLAQSAFGTGFLTILFGFGAGGSLNTAYELWGRP